MINEDSETPSNALEFLHRVSAPGLHDKYKEGVGITIECSGVSSSSQRTWSCMINDDREKQSNARELLHRVSEAGLHAKSKEGVDTP